MPRTRLLLSNSNNNWLSNVWSRKFAKWLVISTQDNVCTLKLEKKILWRWFFNKAPTDKSRIVCAKKVTGALKKCGKPSANHHQQQPKRKQLHRVSLVSNSATQWSLIKTSALIKVKTVSQSALSLTSLAGILMNSNLYLKSTIFMQKVIKLFIILRVGIFGTVHHIQ